MPGSLHQTTVRFFVGVIVGFAAAGMLIRIPRSIVLSPSNVGTVKARRTESAYDAVVSLAPSASGRPGPVAQFESKVEFEPNNDRGGIVVDLGEMITDPSSTYPSLTDQVRLVLRC
jgi:hypothetical protein